MSHPEDAITTARIHLNAKLIIGPHGAGGSNIIFAEEGANLIEVHPVVSAWRFNSSFYLYRPAFFQEGFGYVDRSNRYRRTQSNEWTVHQLHGRTIGIIAQDGHHRHSPITAPIDDIIRHARDLLQSRPVVVQHRFGLTGNQSVNNPV